jgi:predicted acyl esterase
MRSPRRRIAWMTTLPRLLALMGCLALSPALNAANTAANLPAIDLEGVREEHLMIPMRDGKRLSAYAYFPQGQGPWPAVFQQRYGDISGAGSRKTAARFAKGGFVIVEVNYRGTHLSEGVYRGYRALQWGKLQDGYDLCEWIAKQPWCTGKIGTYGGSQAGYAQNYLAVTQPPHLVAQYMTDTGLSLYQEGYRIGGVTRPERFIKGGNSVAREPADNLDMLREWDQHPNYDDYWRDEDASLHFAKMNLPCFTIGSWFDFMNQGSIASFQGRQFQGGPNSRGQQWLIIGPWLHGGYPKSNRIGDLEFPQSAFFDVIEHMQQWFAHYLKGDSKALPKVAPVRYFVMGACGEPGAPGNVWREADNFPPQAQMQSWYLQGDGGLAPRKPAGRPSSTAYLSDPAHPMHLQTAGFPGARDARDFERQSEVRTWTSEALKQPLEITGRLRAAITASSSARDTDFFVRISDVYPDGRSILLLDYPLRARYRKGFEQQALLTPDEPTELEWDIGWLSIILNRGHSLRVTVASTGAPYYEPNPQDGGPITHFLSKPGQPAINRIWHDKAHASKILLPIVK